ncbi:MAG: HAMP domain-containing histidine kinase [bacterium]|nr:HAMP domain-containing histidine kinase [bacterium]
MEASESKAVVAWSRAGLGAVFLAVVLAGVGLVIAIRQTQAIPAQRIAQLKPEALELATAINAEIIEQVRATLYDAAVRHATPAPVNTASPPNRPPWIPAVFVCEGRLPAKVFFIDGQAEHLAHEGKRLVELIAPRLGLRTRAPRSSRGVQFLHETVGGIHMTVAYLGPPSSETFTIMAAVLDESAIRREVIAPILGPAAHLELAATGDKSTVWSESLGPALPFWSICPSPEYVTAQHASAMKRTLSYAGVMLLVLFALILVMRATMRVARREVELGRLRSEFVADVSHELKTPLALIQMFGETLLEGRVPSESKKHEYYEIITRESRRLTHLINNILDFSRIESGKRIYKMQHVRLEDVVRDVYDAYLHELDHKGFTHDLVVADSLPDVEVDPDAISQALLNLISNAIKYSDDERTLTILLERETRRGRRGIMLSVQDRGIGIRPEDRAHLFDGFFRAPDDTVRKRRGAGLGLALVRDIVEAHEGFVEVESRLVKGTTFYLFLPARSQTSEEHTNG